MAKKVFYIILILFLCGALSPINAQTQSAGSSVYSFLSLPYSSRLCALGGDNVAIKDGEISMAMQNPALLCGATDKMLELNYAYYLKGTNLGSALFGWNFGRSKFERQSSMPDKPNYFAVGIHYLDYGKMRYADEKGNLTGGIFTAKDMLIDVMYARQLGPQFTVGVALKPIVSFYESYSAFALAADVGGHFQMKDSTLQIGLTLRNIGWQLKGFYTLESGQVRESLPFNLELGLSYRFKHAPLRLSMTIHNMQRWNLNYGLTNQPSTDDNTQVQWYDMMFRHTIFALDIVPKSDKFYLTLSYNHRRRAEMGLKDQRSLAGLGIGAGVKIKMVSVGFAVSQYTKGNMTYQASISMDINSMLDNNSLRNVPVPPQPSATPAIIQVPELKADTSKVEPMTIDTIQSDSIRTDSISTDTMLVDMISVDTMLDKVDTLISEKTEEITAHEVVLDVETEARAVIRGEYGNGTIRKQMLGENYQTIQDRVNEIYRAKRKRK